MKRRLLALISAMCLFTSGCGTNVIERQTEPEMTRYEASFLTLFDTVTVMKGYAYTQDEFRAASQSVHDALEEYHRLYDIYNDYDGVVNVKSINDNAGGEPLKVDERIIELLAFCRVSVC